MELYVTAAMLAALGAVLLLTAVYALSRPASTEMRYEFCQASRGSAELRQRRANSRNGSEQSNCAN
jgi:hypothetical protein